ncbi:MAG: hypothetical protein ACFFB5_02020 [Promethearchaeota archaeon]
MKKPKNSKGRYIKTGRAKKVRMRLTLAEKRLIEETRRQNKVRSIPKGELQAFFRGDNFDEFWLDLLQRGWVNEQIGEVILVNERGEDYSLEFVHLYGSVLKYDFSDLLTTGERKE